MEAQYAPQHPSELDAEVSVVDLEPGAFAFCRWHGVNVLVWSRQADGAAIARLKQVSITSHREFPDGAISVHLVAPNSGLPTAEARVGLIEIMQNYVGPHECVAIVLGTGGFWASALRSVVVGLRMVTPRFPLMFHSDTLSAARWLTNEATMRGLHSHNPDELADVLDEIARFAGVKLEGPET